MNESAKGRDKTDEFLADPLLFSRNGSDPLFSDYIFGSRNFFTSDCSLAKMVLQSGSESFSGKIGNRVVAAELFGTSVLYEDGHAHKKLRNALSPLFRSKKTDISEVVYSFLQRNKYHCREIARSNLHFFFQILSLQITLAYFNHQIESEFRAAKLVILIDRLSKGLFVNEAKRDEDHVYRSARKARNVLIRQTMIPKSSPIAIALRTAGFDDNVILDQIITLMFAGVDTMSATLTWALGKLTNHQDHRLSPRDAVHQCLVERPPVYFIPRGAAKAATIHDKTIEPGEVVNIMISSLHKKLEQGEGMFLPYGMGVKKCPGQSFSLMVMDELLSELTRNFTVTLTGGNLNKAAFVPGQRPAEPPSLKLQPRKLAKISDNQNSVT
ncbi:MAG: cytochrome P450 [Hyphomicrobiales bacterium]|uniref:cytochrome P450 n=1 Tax=Alphaproteobacteria TaxID=28211 RepID=UPI0032646A30